MPARKQCPRLSMKIIIAGEEQPQEQGHNKKFVEQTLPGTQDFEYPSWG